MGKGESGLPFLQKSFPSTSSACLDEGKCGFVQALRQGRMGMDGCGDVPDGRAQTQDKPGFRDEIRGMGPGDMHAEHLTRGPVRNDLEHAGEFVHGLRLAEFAHLERGRAHIAARLGSLRFGKPHAADFGRRENTGRLGGIVHPPVMPEATAHGAQALDDLRKTNDFDAQWANGDVEPLKAALKERVWQWGSMKEPAWLVESLCGGKFDPHHFTDYLKKKSTELYEL